MTAPPRATKKPRGEAILEMKNLHLVFHTYSGDVQALRGVDLTIHKGETVGLVGESGCGKSQTALAMLRLTPSPPARYPKGEVRYHQPDENNRSKRTWINILKLSQHELRNLRGNDIAMIFQEPMTSLNPVFTVGNQLTESIVTHQDVGVKLRAWDQFWLRRGFVTRRYKRAQRAASDRGIAMLKSIGIADPDKVMHRYPHELSGGMRQRVMIGMGLACDPDLLIADEPTTALDVTVQAQIMDLMRDLQARTGSAILLITHHLGVVAEMVDRVAVMYAGRIVEEAPVRRLFAEPHHPYTLGLLNSIPNVAGTSDHKDLPIIAGMVPSMINPPTGCSFAPRCPFAFARCREVDPAGIKVGETTVACHLWADDVETPQALLDHDASVFSTDPTAPAPTTPPPAVAGPTARIGRGRQRAASPSPAGAANQEDQA